MKAKREIKGLSVKTVAYCALFVALSVVANTFTLYIGVGGGNALSFVYTVCFLSGAVLGPLGGFITGACGDVLGWLINPSGGAFNPAISVISGLIGLISGLTFFLFKKLGKGDKTVLPSVISFVLIFLVCTNLNTVALYFYYMSAKYSFWAFYAIRTPKQLIFWAINFALSLALVKPVRKLVKI